MRLRVGTRPSQLAVRQAELVKAALSRTGIEGDIVKIESHGDRDHQTALSGFKGMGVFVSSLNDALLAGSIDIAVHSAKDLPSELPEDLSINAVLERGPHNDSLVSDTSLEKLPSGAVIGSSSPRRSFMLKRVRPDLLVRDIRGNVDTRLRKLENGEYDAIILAEAGLKRLGISVQRQLLPETDFVPAPCQGIIAVVCRKSHKDYQKISSITDQVTMEQMKIERSLTASMALGCSAPAGIFARYNGREYEVISSFYSRDGKRHTDISGTVQGEKDLGELLDRMKKSVPSDYGLGDSQ